ncbi:MAG: peptidoglycan-binding protein [Anaerolineae bacterium]|nr:peptidoglycan-binding protein [Anaerolineae bacterium]
MNRKQITTAFILLAVVIAASAGSWLAGARIQSPAEAAARTAPPAPSPILVPIEERVLTADVVTRGTARFGLPQSLLLVPSPLKGEIGIVTTLPTRTAQLAEGDLLLTASGRPVFILQGETPVYRDLTPGVDGDDVLQLESGLARLGFDPGPLDGLFDEKTGAAVGAWYTQSGFTPFGPTAGQIAQIRELEDALTAAINEKLTAEEIAAAAPLAVEAARAHAVGESAAVAAYIIQTALDEQAAAEREAQRLGETAERLAADLEVAQAQTGLQIPADELIFVTTLPVRVEGNEAAIGDEAVGPVVLVTNNQLALDSSLPLEEAPLVKPGMEVAIDEPDLGITATGVVARIADIPGTEGVDGFHVYFEVLVDETPLTLDGFSLRLTIPVESTGGAVTVVPLSALSLAPDGSSRIQVQVGDALEYITVTPGLSADGFVEIIPVDGEITAGQLVVIGFE